MDNWLKFMVAIACTCVIAVTAHYGYAEFADRQEVVANNGDVWTDYAKAVALKEDCETLVGPQNTAALKAQYKQCLQYRRGLHGL